MLGYWGWPEVPTLPNPADLVDEAWEESDRQWVADYLNRGQVARSFMGSSRCRLCSRVNGYRDRTDGYYLWPEGLAHYVLDHSVRLPAEFIAHIERRQEALEDIDPDGGTWWRQNATRT